MVSIRWYLMCLEGQLGGAGTSSLSRRLHVAACRYLGIKEDKAYTYTPEKVYTFGLNDGMIGTRTA